MATVPEKHHQPLHNFSLPFLKWGQRIQANNHCRRRSSDSDLNNRRKPNRFRNNLKPEIDEENDAVLLDVDVATPANGDSKPWNLRPRRFVIDAVDGNSNGNGNGAVAKSARPLRCEEENAEEQQMKKKRRLWISLSKEEIEEDIYAFTGSRPSRRPKKRNKIAQKQLDNVFPGLYLVGISADSYRV